MFVYLEIACVGVNNARGRRNATCGENILHLWSHCFAVKQLFAVLCVLKKRGPLFLKLSANN